MKAVNENKLAHEDAIFNTQEKKINKINGCEVTIGHVISVGLPSRQRSGDAGAPRGSGPPGRSSHYQKENLEMGILKCVDKHVHSSSLRCFYRPVVII